MEIRTIKDRIAQSPLAVAGPCVYVLLEAPHDVLYIGHATNLPNRWQGHLKSLQSGTKVYTKWRQRLLDTQGGAQNQLLLCVIPLNQVSQPLYPTLPATTLGALEGQLIGLAHESGFVLLNIDQVPRQPLGQGASLASQQIVQTL